MKKILLSLCCAISLSACSNVSETETPRINIAGTDICFSYFTSEKNNIVDLVSLRTDCKQYQHQETDFSSTDSVLIEGFIIKGIHEQFYVYSSKGVFYNGAKNSCFYSDGITTPHDVSCDMKLDDIIKAEKEKVKHLEKVVEDFSNEA